jgi:hypothetical protein
MPKTLYLFPSELSQDFLSNANSDFFIIKALQSYVGVPTYPLGKCYLLLSLEYSVGCYIRGIVGAPRHSV